MNTFILLLLLESMAQCGAGKHAQWRGYMTILVVNHGIMISISILTAGILPTIKFDVNELWDCVRQEVKWMLGIRYQLSTLSVLDLNCVHYFPHSLLQEKDTSCLPEGNHCIPNALYRIQNRWTSKFTAMLSLAG